jgi:hypothetical protein
MKAPERWSGEAIVYMATSPTCGKLAAWSATSRHQEGLAGAVVALIAMHMASDHSQSFVGLKQRRHKSVLDFECIRNKRTIRIRRVVQ